MPTHRPGTLTAAVLELAFKRGVSERTVWRWLARLRLGGELPGELRLCAACGQLLAPGVTIRRRYCGGACRVRAHYWRRRSEHMSAASKSDYS